MSEVLEPPISAIVKGESVKQLPSDLYIPPHALRVFLKTFQGPLDLLLYLIKKQNLNILEIPILEITRQYMEYIEVMQSLELNLAAEYLLMAATLAEIKSRLLLPRPESLEGDESAGADPRAELIHRLQEYERFKNAAQNLDELPRMERDLQLAAADAPKFDLSTIAIDVELPDILSALASVLKKAALYTHHKVIAEALSVRDRMIRIMGAISEDRYVAFEDLFEPEEGRLGIVVTLIAILELARESVLVLSQNSPSETIYVKAKLSGAQATESEEYSWV